MCGIAGYINLDGRPASTSPLERMIRALVHRGPDGTARKSEGPIALGHARLSILDISGGTQPMSNAHRSLWITFNGEIFNHVELRNELSVKGHHFQTNSDTEV